ncbi:MAG: hypothetical protein JXR37_17745 [Kiritimatiellae bacterium]|nr:hypothetical protein [Kiritimatiellia bacterium]
MSFLIEFSRHLRFNRHTGAYEEYAPHHSALSAQEALWAFWDYLCRE